MSRFYSELLGSRDRKTFSSGNERIDAYFHRSVSQDIKRNYATCYVLVDKDTGDLAGFYTLSSTNILLVDLPGESASRLPRYPLVPAVLIGWLARAQSFKGQAVGPLLLFDAIRRVAQSTVGAHALYADAIDAAAIAFYVKHQFKALTGRPNALFLPMATALKLLDTMG